MRPLLFSLALLASSCAGTCSAIGGGAIGHGAIGGGGGAIGGPPQWPVDPPDPPCEIPGTPSLWYEPALDEGYNNDDPVALASSHGAIALDATQSTEGAQPTYKATGGAGNRAWWSFDGGDYLVTTALSEVLGQPNMVVVVGMSSNMLLRQKLVDGIASGRRHIVEFNTDVDAFAGSFIDGPVVTQDEWHSFVVTFDSTSSSFIVDGETVATEANGGGNSLSGLTFGHAYTLTDHPLVGGLTLVGVYDTPVTDEEILEYLDCAYGEFPQ